MTRKDLYVFHTDAIFFSNIFGLYSIELVDMDPTDTKDNCTVFA